MIIEQLTQIKQLGLTMKMDSKTRIEINNHSITIHESDKSTTIQGLQLIPNQIQYTHQSATLQLQIKMNELQEAGQTPQPEPNVTTLQCHQCCNLLTDELKFDKRLSLPTDYWFEMSECWACHKEDYSNLPGQMGGMILPQLNVLLVGVSYYLLHPLNMDTNRVRLHYTGRESTFKSNRWVQIQCNRCLYPIGDAFMDPNSPINNTGNNDHHHLVLDIKNVTIFKMFKYGVDVFGKENGVLIRNPYKSFSYYFIQDLIESIKAHANYRFLLADEMNGTPMMMLWVLNWNSHLGVLKEMDIEKDNDKKNYTVQFTQGVKLLYCLAVDKIELVPVWQMDRRVEQLQYTNDCLVELMLSFQKRTQQMALQQQTLNGFQVVFYEL
ncbi:ubiquitin-conjugating enzyme E2-binding protein [Globomyces pollinis-pini]|nr:ubiquitin-conjugating enzyme E2-binding protein [Globomyces pollinis-pini]